MPARHRRGAPFLSARHRPRLVLLHYTALPVLGGVESIVESHRRVLVEAGYETRVVAGRGDAEVIPELDSRHPEVEAITLRLAAGDAAPDEFRRLVATIGGKLDAVLAGSDLVIAHNVMTMHFNLPLAASLCGRRVLAWTHDLAWINPRHRAFHRDGPPYDLLHRPAPGVRYTAISERVRTQLAETYGVTAEAVPNGIDRHRLLRIRPATTAFLEKAGMGGAEPLVLVPFRVTRRKRLELALEAAAIAGRRHPSLKLVVSGPLGPHSADNRAYWEELRRLRDRLGLRERAVFLHEHGDPHPVDDEMIAELYQLASAVLLTSESEGFGLPVLEAGLVRLPVVCSDLDVFREVAGDTAWTFPIDAPAEAVADALAAALATPQARLQAGVAAYDWSQVLPRIEEEVRLALA